LNRVEAPGTLASEHIAAKENCHRLLYSSRREIWQVFGSRLAGFLEQTANDSLNGINRLRAIWQAWQVFVGRRGAAEKIGD
jgi:hypothetical protein